MFDTILEALRHALSGVAAKQLTANISRYHRIQASPDFRQAAEMVYETLFAWGLDAQLLSYPANESVQFWGRHMFQEWNGVSGTLHLVTPAEQAQKLADYREVRLSLIPRSTPFEGQVKVVVPKNKGEEPQDYADLDVSGQVVLTNGEVMTVHQRAVEERGAVGLLFDGMRTLEKVRPEWSLPDAIQYTSFWWWNAPKKGFGFALTPRQGHWLRRLVQNAPKDEPVRVRAHVVSRLYDGAIENVSATIPGTSADEILLVSHLCHPAPCANDNASGAAVAMEVARALHTLINAGKLPPPRRTLRFLWVPEMTGSQAYLFTRAQAPGEPAPIVAGLNLDMVGEDQAQCGSVMIIDTPPQASASFATDLLECIREALFEASRPCSLQGQVAPFRYATVPFAGGSDHLVFSDPAIGVPMPMLNQWPDRFYHTTADTIDKVSVETLTQSGLLAGTYLYWLASAGPRQVEWLAHEMSARFKRRIVANLQAAVTAHMTQGDETPLKQTGLPWQERLNYWVERQRAALATLSRLQADFDHQPWSRAVTHFAANEWATVQTMLTPEALPARNDTPDGEHSGRVPRRLYPGPVWARSLLRYHPPELAERLRALKKAHPELPDILPTLALYWADGKRDLAEIVRRVELECGVRAPEYITGYFEILADMGTIEW
jgi:aminopeptidase YwaD